MLRYMNSYVNIIINTNFYRVTKYLAWTRIMHAFEIHMLYTDELIKKDFQQKFTPHSIVKKKEFSHLKFM